MQCLICKEKKKWTDILSQFTSIGKSIFVSALNKRLDEVNIKMFHAEAVNLQKSVQAVYRCSCYKSYTSKHICSPFQSEEASNLIFNDDIQFSDCCPSVSVCVRVLECSRSTGALVYFVATKHFRKIKNYSSLNQMSVLKMF